MSSAEHADAIPQWDPLDEALTVPVATDRLGDRALPVAATLGTCGDPRSANYIRWREDGIRPIAASYGLDARNIWSPVVEEWDPSLAMAESVMGARAGVLAIHVDEHQESPTSTMEAGMLVFGGILRGQDVFVCMNEAADNLDPAPRELARAALVAAAKAYPIFSVVRNVEQLGHQVSEALRRRIAGRISNLQTSVKHTPSLHSGPHRPQLYLSGTSGAHQPAWIEDLQGHIQTLDTMRGSSTPVEHSYRPDWSTEDIPAELDHKLNDPVQLIAITKETESLGALAELGPRMLHAYLKGQSLGVYIEMHDSDSKSPTNRTRRLALEHLGRLREDFPRLPIRVAGNLADLAIFGVDAYNEHRDMTAGT